MYSNIVIDTPNKTTKPIKTTKKRGPDKPEAY